MKKIKFLPVILLLLSNLSCSSESFPTYEEVVTHFYSNYGLAQNESNMFIRFVKKPKGYFVEHYNTTEGTYTNPQLLWSKAGNKFLEVDYRSTDTPNEKFINQTLDSHDVFFFNLYPYYGYDVWEKDVIAALEKRKNISDDDLYALGRAYSVAAGNLLNNNYGFSAEYKETRLPEEGRNLLNDKVLSLYKANNNKAISFYKKLAESNPEYETIVGTISNKLSNEYMTAFLDLLTYQNQDEALKVIDKANYNNMYVDMAKNYLNSCEENAILFTHGDNDTYPLLFVQAMLGFRQDVMVVNTSLLNAKNYVNLLRDNKIFNAQPVLLTLNKETYKEDNLNVVYIKSGNIKMNVTEVCTGLNEEHPVFYNEQYPDYPILPSKNFRIKTSQGEIMDIKVKKNFLYKGDLFALDIIQSNIDSRPIYILNNNVVPLNDYSELHGFAFKVVVKESLYDSKIMQGGFNPDETYNVAIKEFYRSNKEQVTDNTIMYSYLRAFSELASYYQRHGDNEKCEKVIGNFLKQFPQVSSSMTYALTPMVETSVNIGLNNEAKELTNQVLSGIEEKISSPEFEEKDISMFKYVLTELRRVFENTDIEEDVMPKIEELEAKLEKM